MERQQNLRFRCLCGAQLDKVSNSRNRTGTARLRTYRCSKCEHKTNTVEVIIDDDLRSGATGEAVMRRHVLESVTPRELIEALKFHLLDKQHD